MGGEMEGGVGGRGRGGGWGRKKKGGTGIKRYKLSQPKPPNKYQQKKKDPNNDTP